MARHACGRERSPGLQVRGTRAQMVEMETTLSCQRSADRI